jgi:hypothetical protein
MHTEHGYAVPLLTSEALNACSLEKPAGGLVFGDDLLLGLRAQAPLGTGFHCHRWVSLRALRVLC